MEAYVYAAQGRNSRTLSALIIAWAVLAALYLFLNAALWIILLLALATLPALWDLWRDPSAGLVLDDATMRWHSGRRHADIALSEIEKVRLDRSWDFTIRAIVVLQTGRKLRLPMESTPPAEALAAALEARQIPHERNPFSLF